MTRRSTGTCESSRVATTTTAGARRMSRCAGRAHIRRTGSLAASNTGSPSPSISSEESPIQTALAARQNDRVPRPGATLPTIVVDTREQDGIFDWSPWPSVVRTLRHSDYAILECQFGLRVERKNLKDAVNSLIFEHDRLLREFERARMDRCPTVMLIEGSVEDVMERRFQTFNHKLGRPAPDLNPNAILGAAQTIVSLGVPVIWAGDRKGAKATAIDLFQRAWRRHLENRCPCLPRVPLVTEPKEAIASTP